MTKSPDHTSTANPPTGFQGALARPVAAPKAQASASRPVLLVAPAQGAVQAAGKAFGAE